MKLIPLAPLGLFATHLLLPFPVQAETTQQLEDLVVTATRTPVKLSQIGSSVTVISADQIKRRQFLTLSDALKDVPGLRVVQLGVSGSQTSVFIRGSNSDHTLVLVDGIEMNDPSSPAGAFDFSNFILEDIDSIEIIRGSQSVLYGSDAIGGVIHIRTRKGQGSARIRGKLEVGSNSSNHETVAVSGAKDQFNYSATLGSLNTGGESIVPERVNIPREQIDDDGYHNTVFSGRLGWQNTEQLEINFVARYIDTQTDIDGGFDFNGTPVEDLDAKNGSEQLYLGAELKGSFINDQWRPTFSISKIDIDRDNRNDRQDLFGTLVNTDFTGKKLKLSLQNDFSFFKNNLITFGLEYEDEEMQSNGASDFGGFIISQDSDADRQTKSIYLQDQFNLGEKFFATLGVRYDDPDDFSSRVSYRATANYLFPSNTRIRGNYGTGFKAPSLLQLFGFTPNNFGSAFRGNTDLKPETSRGWELGIEQSLFNGMAIASLTYYENDIENLITTVFLPGFDSTTVNRDEAEISGLELGLALYPLDNLDLRFDYTLTDTEDQSGEELLRRPKHKASLELNYQATAKLDFNFNLLYTGKAMDIDGFGQTLEADDYTVFNLAGNYQLNNQTRLFARIENLSDTRYEPAFGFQALNRTAYIGIEISSR